MITLTEKAAKKIKEIASGEELPLIVRMKLIGGGCNGYQQDLQFEEERNVSDFDEIINDPAGIKIVVDQLSLQYLNPTSLDYLEGPFESGFKFISENVRSSCGCGKSVGF